MIFLKFISLSLVFAIAFYIGWLISKKYSNRVLELKEMKNALNMFETKIKFTYASVPEIFKEISENIKNVIGNIFEVAWRQMEHMTAGEAWQYSLDNVQCNLKQEDKDVIKKLGRMLGKTDVDGQISEIKLVNEFLNTQIQLAEEEKNKNEKMYKTLGGIIGLTIVIVLI